MKHSQKFLFFLPSPVYFFLGFLWRKFHLHMENIWKLCAGGIHLHCLDKGEETQSPVGDIVK